MSSKPYMKFYPSDYLADTRSLSLSEHGAYLLLIMECWSCEFLPLEDSKIARILGITENDWVAMKPTFIPKFFKKTEAGYFNKKVSKLLAEMLEKSNKASHAAEVRWAKENANAYANASSEHMQNECLDDAIPDTRYQIPDTRIQRPESKDQTPEDYIAPSRTPNLSEIFNFWKDTMEARRSTLTDKRKKRILDRLKKYSVDDLKTAIEGCAGDDWHTDNKVNDIEYILRNDENVEKFIELYHNPKVVMTKGAVRQRASIKAAREFVEME